MADENKIIVQYSKEEFQASVKSIIAEQKKTETFFKSSFAKIAITFGTLYAGYKLASAGAKALSNVIKSSIVASSIQEDSVNKLNAALAQTGQLSIATSRDLQNFSAQMEATTRFGDEAINTQLSFALSMGASTTQAKNLTLAAANLAAATGKDLSTAQAQLNKTLGGYAGELGEVLPQIKNLTAAQLKNGEVATLINSIYAGRAQQDVKTYSGALDQNANSLGSLQEKIGDLITQNPVFIKIINLTSSLFLTLADIVGNNMPTAMKFFNSFIIGTISLVKNFGIGTIDVFITVKRGVEDFIDSLSLATINSITAFNSFTKGFTLFKTAFISRVKEFGAEFSNDFISLILTPINFVKEKLGQEKIDFQIFDIEKIKKDNEDATASATEAFIRQKQINDLQKQGFIEAQEEKKELRNQEREEFDELFGSFEETLDSYVESVRKAGQEEIQVLKNTTTEKQKLNESFWASIIKGSGEAKKYEDKTNQEKAADFKATLNTISTLQKNKNKELALLGKAAAISTATIDGYIAVNKALTATPFPPVNFAFAALVGAASAANVANIASTPIGFATGGVIGGPSTSGDNLLIAANAKERVLTAEQNRNFEAVVFNNNNVIPQLLGTLIDITERGRIINNQLNGVSLSNELKQIESRNL